MNQHDIDTILTLRLLIARAANQDSLGWWDDHSLTGEAGYVLQRTFPVAPTLAGRRLALEAALTRHQALVPADQHSVHLYRLTADNQDRLATRFHTLEAIETPEAPIRSLADLRTHLVRLTGQQLPYTVERRGPAGAVRIAIPPAPAGTDPVVHRAQTLAWAYLEADAGQVSLPYTVDN